LSERWERRERKLRARGRRMPVHGKGMAVIYRNSLSKRLRELSDRRRRMLIRPRAKGKRNR